MENKDIGITTLWRELGKKMLNSNDILQVIEADHSVDDNSCCSLMFEKWLEITPNASWSQLVTALENIDLHNAARTVERQHQIDIGAYIFMYYIYMCVKRFAKVNHLSSNQSLIFIHLCSIIA